MLRNWKVTVQYDGTRYQGWQIQPDFPSVQEEIQKILSDIYQSPIQIDGSGRTDAGVHALGQVFSFTETREVKFTEKSFVVALNSLLPDDIRLLSAEIVPDDFHARFSAVGKTYIYVIETSNRSNPFWRNFTWNRRNKLDLDLLKKAIKKFEGEHDFSAFTVKNKFLKGTAVREIFKTDLEAKDSMIFLRFTGSGFLYKMVRSLTGQAVEVGSGLASLDKIEPLFESGCRLKAARTAPPQGLYLAEVYYEKKELESRLSVSPVQIFNERFYF